MSLRDRMRSLFVTSPQSTQTDEQPPPQTIGRSTRSPRQSMTAGSRTSRSGGGGVGTEAEEDRQLMDDVPMHAAGGQEDEREDEQQQQTLSTNDDPLAAVLLASGTMTGGGGTATSTLVSTLVSAAPSSPRSPANQNNNTQTINNSNNTINSNGNAAVDLPPDVPVTIRLVPYNPYFSTLERTLIPAQPAVVGRYQRHQVTDDMDRANFYLRSTVVSRKHALILFKDGQLMLQDAKSLGGTYLNYNRLSAAGKESDWVSIQHGDTIQFGVDYRPDVKTGQVRNKDRCVEVRLEIPCLKKALKRDTKPAPWQPTNTATECCICLSRLFSRQSLFIAPCAHAFHYRCILPLLRFTGTAKPSSASGSRNGPGMFTCPMCRQSSDLLEELFSDDDDDDDHDEDHDEKISVADEDERGARVEGKRQTPAASQVPKDVADEMDDRESNVDAQEPMNDTDDA